ncbi:MAG: RHS repeat-associated core domain-containing protein [Saprospiraceae bacterium]
MVWQNRGQTNTQGYNFEYDYLNRVIKSNYFDVTGGTGTMNNNYREYATYDVRGNILTMGRHGLISPTWTRAKIDSLTYTYTSGTNKLSKINDLAANAYGFNMNGASTSATYTFDNNGNIKIDPYKKISNTTFNHLNLPDIISVTGSPNKEIRYTYDASGLKLRKQITLVGGSPSGLKQDYVDGIEYANDVIESIHFADGRAVWIPGTSTWRYEFNVSDHLGNVRAVVSDMDNDGSLYNDFATEITQVTSYYPFGLKMEGAYQNNGSAIDTRYQYNGKEFNDDLGLNLYDYGARWYDPSIGRWTSTDPLAKADPTLSPYRYGFNNPLKFIDPIGMFESSNTLYQNTKETQNEDTEKQVENKQNQPASTTGNPWPPNKGNKGDRHSDEDGTFINNGNGWVSEQNGSYILPTVEVKSDANNKPNEGFGLALFGLAKETASYGLYNKETWFSLNMAKEYLQRFNGNGSTGGKNLSKALSKDLTIFGYGLGAYGAYNINESYRHGEIGTGQMLAEQSVNFYSAIGGLNGAAVALGWESGRWLTSQSWYRQNVKPVLQFSAHIPITP